MQHQILVCDRGGIPRHWVNWQEGVVLKYKKLLSYELGDPAVFFGGLSRMTGERSHVDVGQIVFLKEVLKYDSRVPPLTNENLFARDLNICAYCGRHYQTSKLSRDHIHPVSKGGPNTWMNCVTACKRCNHDKADMTLSEADMELLYVPYTPNHASRLIMQNRNILSDQMDFIKNFLPEHDRLHPQYDVISKSRLQK